MKKGLRQQMKSASLLFGTAVVTVGIASGSSGVHANTLNSGGVWTQVAQLGWPAPPTWQGNPAANGGVGYDAWVYCFEGLFQYARPTGKIYYRMAQSVDNSNPAQTVVHLYHNIRWSDGAPFTSKDVWGFYILNWGAEVTKYLKSIETPDPYTVIFKWANPKLDPKFKMYYLAEDYQWIPYHLAKKWIDQDAALFAKLQPDTNPHDQGLYAYQLKQTPQFLSATGKVWQDFNSHYHPKTTICTGPYVVSKVTSSDMYLKPNPYYYKKSAIKFKEIHLMNVPDGTQQLALLRSGKLSWMDATPPKDILTSILASNKNLVHYIWPDNVTVGFVFNQRHSPFQNETFRKAIVYALDRKKIREVANYYGIDTEYAGLGILPWQINKYITNDVLKKFTKYPYDPKKAARLLESIGWKKGPDGIWRDPNGKSYNFIIAGPSNWEPYITPAGELVAEQLTAFGLPTQFKSVDQSLYWSNAVNGTYDMVFDFPEWEWLMDPWSAMMTLYNNGRPFQEAGLPKDRKGVALFIASGYDGQSINVNQLLAKMPYMTESQRRHAIDEIAYATNENAWYVNLWGNTAGEWLNTAYVKGLPKGLPWQNAFSKYNRNLPMPPADLLQDIADISEWFAGGQHFVNGKLGPN
ncbi:ABC transporter substrate-binding protein [Alicyclobacillus cellulosilyticus]|nr:ABC transporter substrate-binding protein [Alicyclobacillus cellulosilyticus]